MLNFGVFQKGVQIVTDFAQLVSVQLTTFTDIPRDEVIVLEWDEPRLMPEQWDYVVVHGDLADYAAFFLSGDEATGRAVVWVCFNGREFEEWAVYLNRVDVLLTRHSLEMETAAAFAGLADLAAA